MDTFSQISPDEEFFSKIRLVKKSTLLAHSIEQIYYTRNLNLITPFAFKRNLVLNSEEFATMNKKWEGCGSSRTLSSVICEPAPPLQCPSGDVFIAEQLKVPK